MPESRPLHVQPAFQRMFGRECPGISLLVTVFRFSSHAPSVKSYKHFVRGVLQSLWCKEDSGCVPVKTYVQRRSTVNSTQSFALSLFCSDPIEVQAWTGGMRRGKRPAHAWHLML